MSSYPREEIEEMVERWLQVNRDAEASGDWKILADLYTEDATYGWNYGPKTEFMAVGRDEIRDLAVGAEMGGLEGWTYPYQAVIIDEKQGHVIGFWKQVADGERADGTPYEIGGIGGSWFQYGGDFQWSWQRDWFDFGNAGALFLELIEAGKLSDGMTERMNRAMRPDRPGYYPIHKAPKGIWDLTT